MKLDAIYYTNLLKTAKQVIQKNARRRKFDFEVYKPTERVSKMKPKIPMYQIYAMLEAKKNSKLPLQNILIATGMVDFDFSPHYLPQPPEDYEVLYLNGDIRRYIISEDERNNKMEEVEVVVEKPPPEPSEETTPASTETKNSEETKDSEEPETRIELRPIPDRRRRAAGPWFAAEMMHADAFVVRGTVLDKVLAAAKSYFPENQTKTIFDLFIHLNLKGYVSNFPCCGIKDHTLTPERLRELPYVSTETDDTHELRLDLPEVSDEELPPISIISTVYNDDNGFFLTQMSFQIQKYPADKIEWIIIDDSEKNNDVQKMLPLEEKRVKYYRCEVQDGSRLSLGKKLNLACNYASHDIVVIFMPGMYYPPQSLKTRVIPLLKNETLGMVGCTNVGVYNVKSDLSYSVQQADTNDHLTVYHQETVAFKKEFWWRRIFSEGLIGDNTQNIVCIPFMVGRYDMCLDLPHEFTGIKIETVKINEPPRDKVKEFSFRDMFHTLFKESLVFLERETIEYARNWNDTAV